MTGYSKLDFACRLLPEKIKAAVMAAGKSEREKINELRLRKNRCFSAVLYGKEYFVTPDGRFMNSPDCAVEVTAADIEFVFGQAFRDSVHSFPKEMNDGYITCEGGNRVGFCGTAVFDSDVSALKSVKNISSVNIRIAREVFGSATQIYQKAFGGGACSLIIASPPCGGKTTVLRDLCRLLSERYTLSVIDERGELACVHDGVAQNDIGLRCDIFDGYVKSDAAVTAIKVMSPEILVCDEIGTKTDYRALQYAVNSGVKLVCTCHAADFSDLKKRPAAGRLIRENAFDYAAILGTGAACGRLTAFYELAT